MKYKFMIITKTIITIHKIQICDNKGCWEIDVYESGLSEISEQEMHMNLEEQFFKNGEKK